MKELNDDIAVWGCGPTVYSRMLSWDSDGDLCVLVWVWCECTQTPLGWKPGPEPGKQPPGLREKYDGGVVWCGGVHTDAPGWQPGPEPGKQPPGLRDKYDGGVVWCG
eukprot:1161491-Pelagomonas_calceolata.AAC.1